ncbi:MAG: DUF47 domain-containing protein [Chloroflexi bacterium]|nr:DUF47 domain-containing protein [Chloroflexota bacterium]
MRFSLMPRKSIFFVLFSQHAENALEAAKALENMLSNFVRVEDKVKSIHAIEHHGDKLTHEIIRVLNETFVTPLDREDIIGLASRLDDITDLAYDVAETIQLYHVTAVRPAAVRQAKVLVAAAEEIRVATDKMERLRDLEPHWIKLHTLENQGDEVFREALVELFAGSTDPVEIIKWKDLHEKLEQAIDRCEDVANIVEMLVVKHA